jgi:transcriptional regulator
VRFNPHHVCEDPEFVRELIAANPWATLVSVTDDRPVASHYPVLLDDSTDDLAIVTHVGRPDERIHKFGDGEMLVIVQGRHGYISPSWYAPGATRAPTWNFSVAHCYGVPEVLSPEANLRVLTRLVDHFERRVEHPVAPDAETGARLSPGTVGIRVPITRFECKRKLSQDKDPISRRQVIAALRASGPYSHPQLADEMERELGR